MTTREEVMRRTMLVPCESKEALGRWIRLFLDIDLPDCIVDPDSNSSPLDMVYEPYALSLQGGDPERSRFLFWASRDSYKTLGFAIFQTLALLHLDSDVVHMSAIMDQAAKAAQYVKNNFERPYLRDCRVGQNLRTVHAAQYVAPGRDAVSNATYQRMPEEQRAPYAKRDHSTIIIPATVRAANGQHALTLCVDEAEIIQDKQALREARLIPTSFNGRMPVTLITSSRKFAGGVVQDMIDTAAETKLQLRHFNLIDITERCPPERHRPDLPKERVFRSDELLKVVKPDQYQRLEPNAQKLYQEAEVYAGCAACEMYPACRGNLVNQRSNSKLLRPIPYVIQLFRDTDLMTAQSQLLCRKPMTKGLIYPQMDPTGHRVSAERMVELVTGNAPGRDVSFDELVQVLNAAGAKWFGGMDFGYSDPWAAVLGARVGELMFVLKALEVPGLDTSQQLAVAEQQLLSFNPLIYGDVADKQSIISFRKAHFRMAEWKKTPGSILGGISACRRKLAPFGADPQILFLAEEQGVERLFNQLSVYRWKVDSSGEPTEVPEEGADHLPDAFRYMVMNVFAKNQAGISTGDHQLALPAQAAVQPHPEQQVARPAAWMQDLVAQWNANNDPEATADQPVQKAGGLKWSI